MKGSIQQISWFGKLLILTGLYLIGEFVFAMLGILLIKLIYPDVDLAAFNARLNVPGSGMMATVQEINALKIYQAVTSIGRFLLVGIYFLYLCGEQIIAWLNLNKPIQLISIITIFLILISSASIVGLVYEWNKAIHLPSAFHSLEESMRNLEVLAEKQTDLFLSGTSVVGLIINIFIVGIIAAVAEEVFFRGIFQQIIFRDTGKIHLAVWVGAFFFSFIHYQFFGFFPRLILGALLGYLYYWSGSLWAPITAHLINNVGGVVAKYLVNTGMLDKDVTETVNWIAALISVPFVILFIRIFQKHETKLSLTDGKRLDDGVLDNG